MFGEFQAMQSACCLLKLWLVRILLKFSIVNAWRVELVLVTLLPVSPWMLVSESVEANIWSPDAQPRGIHSGQTAAKQNNSMQGNQRRMFFQTLNSESRRKFLGPACSTTHVL